jgi:predicted transport protein
MKIIELEHNPPSMNALLEAAQDDDLLLVRAGHPLVRIEKFDDDDLEDWKYEHSAQAIALGESARKQYRNGEFRSLKGESEATHLSKTNHETKALYLKYREAILAFGDGIRVKPVGRYIGFWVYGRRFVNFHIHEQHFKIWLGIKPGSLNDPKKLTRRNQAGHTVSVRDDEQFEYIVGLIRQTYSRKR